MDDLAFLISYPRRLVVFGKGLLTIGMLPILAGLFGWVALAGNAALKGSNVSLTLANLYPRIWTWWIPETVAGWLPVGICVISGLFLTLTGRFFERLDR